MRSEIGIHFGAVSPSISKQLKDQGFKFDQKKVDRFEELSNYHNHLRISLLLPNNVTDIINKKLFNQIKKHVVQMNNPKRPSPTTVNK